MPDQWRAACFLWPTDVVVAVMAFMALVIVVFMEMYVVFEAVMTKNIVMLCRCRGFRLYVAGTLSHHYHGCTHSCKDELPLLDHYAKWTDGFLADSEFASKLPSFFTISHNG